MFGFHRSDLRPAALRAVLVFGALTALLVYNSRGLTAPLALVLVSAALAWSFMGAAAALIERRATRSAWPPGGAFGVLLVALLFGPSFLTQVTIATEMVRLGSVAGGLASGWSRVSGSALDAPFQLLSVSFVSALPWTIVALARLQRSALPSVVTLGLGGLSALALADLMGTGAAETLAVMTVAIHAASWLADLLEGWIARRLLRDEVRALQALFTAGQLRSGDLWLLAAADDPAARLLLGAAAPDAQPDLEPWVRQLASGGQKPLQRAAVLAARLAVAATPEHLGAFAALAAWERDPSPETVRAVEAAQADLPSERHPAVDALRAAFDAVTAQGRWAAETIRAAAVRAAVSAAEVEDAAAVRATIGAAIRGRILRGAPVAGAAA